MKLTNSRRRKTFLMLSIPSICALCFFALRAVSLRTLARADSTVSPFVFQAQIYLYGRNPAGELCKTLMVARRSDGTMVYVNSEGPLAKGLYSRKIEYVDGGTEGLVDAMRIKESWPPRSEEATAFHRRLVMHPPSNCVLGGDTLTKEHDLVLGHDVAVIEHIALKTTRITSWKAPDLACEALQYRVEEQQPDGSYKLMSIQKPVSLQLTEPDPRLFENGQDYAELRPSEMAGRVSTWLGYSGTGPAEQIQAKIGDPGYDKAWAANPGWTPPE